MGGYGSFALAAKQPERFAAIVPICGGGLYFDALGLSRMPMWVYHGDADRIVPVDESRRMVETANRINGENARLTEYEGRRAQLVVTCLWPRPGGRARG